jgi:hypothetical protein
MPVLSTDQEMFPARNGIYAHVQYFAAGDNHVLSIMGAFAKCTRSLHYSTALRHFRPVEELPELADGPSGCGEVARGGCLFAWNFSVAVVDYFLT